MCCNCKPYSNPLSPWKPSKITSFMISLICVCPPFECKTSGSAPPVAGQMIPEAPVSLVEGQGRMKLAFNQFSLGINKRLNWSPLLHQLGKICIFWGVLYSFSRIWRGIDGISCCKLFEKYHLEHVYLIKLSCHDYFFNPVRLVLNVDWLVSQRKTTGLIYAM